MTNPSVPTWADFFTDEDRFSRFVQALDRVLSEQGFPYTIDLEQGFWKRDGSEATFGITNMAQLCNQAPEDEWETYIRSYVVATQQPTDTGPEDFEVARPMLRVRFFPKEGIDPAILVTKDVSPHFYTCLALDLPDRVLSVKPELLKAWGLHEEELFEIGLQNVLATANPNRQDFPSPDGTANAILIAGDDFYTASISLALDRFLGEPRGPYGRLVAVPNRHVTLVSEIETAGSLAALSFIVPNARQMFHQGPGSITPYAFWIAPDGKWTTLDIDLTPRGVAVRGPDEFTEGVMRPLQQ